MELVQQQMIANRPKGRMLKTHVGSPVGAKVAEQKAWIYNDDEDG